MAEPVKKQDDFFSDENAVKGSWVSWGKIGDSVKGTIVDRYERPDTLSKVKGAMQVIYEIKVMSGSFHALLKQEGGGPGKPADEPTILKEGEIWNIGCKPTLAAQMKNAKIGQIVGLKFMETVKSKTPGNYDAKIVKVFTQGVMDEAWLTAMEEEAKRNDPNNF